MTVDLTALKTIIEFFRENGVFGQVTVGSLSFNVLPEQAPLTTERPQKVEKPGPDGLTPSEQLELYGKAFDTGDEE